MFQMYLWTGLGLVTGLTLQYLWMSQTVKVLEQELQWERAKVMARESDLERLQAKLSLPSQKIQEQQRLRILELESELEKSNSKLLWMNQRDFG
mgnify:FL=1